MYRTPLTIAALLFASLAHAASYETSILSTSIPEAANGSLEVRSCSTCPLKLVRLDARSQFKVGRNLVSFEEFKRFVRQVDGDRYLHVSYDATTSTVIRLRVSGQLAPRAR